MDRTALLAAVQGDDRMLSGRASGGGGSGAPGQDDEVHASYKHFLTMMRFDFS